MEESTFYQAILEEGRAKGAVQEAKKLLLRQGSLRFGTAPDAATLAAVEAITDLDRLEQLGERLLEVSSWPEFLANT